MSTLGLLCPATAALGLSGPPPSPSTDRIVQLQPCDANLMLQAVELVYAVLTIEAVLDPELLREKLWALVERPEWRRLGARLRRKVGRVSRTYYA